MHVIFVLDVYFIFSLHYFFDVLRLHIIEYHTVSFQPIDKKFRNERVQRHFHDEYFTGTGF